MYKKIFVSVPIRGLFNLTSYGFLFINGRNYEVSVPIRGLFNLTSLKWVKDERHTQENVSVPIRGLFNLTKRFYIVGRERLTDECFRPH